MSIDLDRIFLLLSVAEKAAAHDPVKYRWIHAAATAELDKMSAENQKEASDGE